MKHTMFTYCHCKDYELMYTSYDDVFVDKKKKKFSKSKDEMRNFLVNVICSALQCFDTTRHFNVFSVGDPSYNGKIFF